MAVKNLLRRLKASENGATIVEFAIVSSVFFLLLCATIEYGLILMTKIAIESVTQQVSRSSQVNATVPGCSAGDRACVVRTLLADKTLGIVNPKYVLVTSKVITSASDATPAKPDLCLDTVNVPSPATCIAYLNNNGIAGYQQATALTSASVGAVRQLAEIRVTYVWRVIFPLMRPFFTNQSMILSSTTVVQNEPS